MPIEDERIAALVAHKLTGDVPEDYARYLLDALAERDAEIEQLRTFLRRRTLDGRRTELEVYEQYAAALDAET